MNVHKIFVFFVLLFLGLFFFFSLPLQSEELLLPEKSVIDLHCHVAGIGTGESGCFISRSMKNSYKFSFYLKAMDVSLSEIEKQGDILVFKRLNQKIEASRYIKKVVILAFDGIVKNGELDKETTEIYVPNEYVAEAIKKYKSFLLGASVNPYRKDALEKLEWVKQNGAVLLKWIPSIMHIDPQDSKIIPFYKKMIALKLPLLCHVGQERSFTGALDELCDPLRLELPLSLGVTVIAAHIATTGKSNGQNNYERILPLFEKYPNLYADISSLTQINKLGYLSKALKDPRLKNKAVGTGRLVYGTDWPLQFFPLVSPIYHWRHLKFRDLFRIARIQNKWDRDIFLKFKMGTPKEVFSLGETLLDPPPSLKAEPAT